MNNDKKIEKIQLYTQKRLNKWYENAKLDFGINGRADVAIDNVEARIVYMENGVAKMFTEKTMFILDEPIDYLFNIWSEE